MSIYKHRDDQQKDAQTSGSYSSALEFSPSLVARRLDVVRVARAQQRARGAWPVPRWFASDERGEAKRVLAAAAGVRRAGVM